MRLGTESKQCLEPLSARTLGRLKPGLHTRFHERRAAADLPYPDRRAALFLGRAWGSVGLSCSNGALWVGAGSNEAHGIGAESFSSRARHFSLCAPRIFHLERVLAICDVFDSVRVF